MGAVEERIIEQASQAGEPLPDRIANAPELLRGLTLYYNAFQDLSTSRQSAFGVGQIPWQAINDYCLTYEIEDEQREDMFLFIGQMDSVYREHVEKKHKLESGDKSAPAGGTRGKRPKKGRRR